MGDVCESKLTVPLWKFAKSKEDEEIFNGYYLSGIPDVFNLERGILIDYKTTRRIPKVPYEHHKNQINIYSAMIDMMYAVSVEVLLIAYIAQFDVHPVLVEKISFDDVADMVVNGARPLVEFLRSGEIPEYKEVWECKYCEVKDLCHARLETNTGVL